MGNLEIHPFVVSTFVLKWLDSLILGSEVWFSAIFSRLICLSNLCISTAFNGSSNMLLWKCVHTDSHVQTPTCVLYAVCKYACNFQKYRHIIIMSSCFAQRFIIQGRVCTIRHGCELFFLFVFYPFIRFDHHRTRYKNCMLTTQYW